MYWRGRATWYVYPLDGLVSACPFAPMVCSLRGCCGTEKGWSWGALPVEKDWLMFWCVDVVLPSVKETLRITTAVTPRLPLYYRIRKHSLALAEITLALAFLFHRFVGRYEIVFREREGLDGYYFVWLVGWSDE